MELPPADVDIVLLPSHRRQRAGSSCAPPRGRSRTSWLGRHAAAAGVDDVDVAGSDPGAGDAATAAASAAVLDARRPGRRGSLLGGSPVEPLQARRLLAGVHEALTPPASDSARSATVVCGLGPGTFTGLRIGVATARASGAGGRRCALGGVPTLEALAGGLAAGEAGASATTFVPLIDGRRDEVFAAGLPAPRGRIGRRSRWGRAAGRAAPPTACQLVAPVIALAAILCAELATLRRPGRARWWAATAPPCTPTGCRRPSCTTRAVAAPSAPWSPAPGCRLAGGHDAASPPRCRSTAASPTRHRRRPARLRRA